AISIAAVLTIQVLVWCTVAGRQYRQAITTIEANQNVTMLATAIPPENELTAIAQKLAPSAVLIALANQGETVVATCLAAQAVIGDCSRPNIDNPKVSQLGLWADQSAKVMIVESVSDYANYEESALLVVATSGSLDKDKVTRIFNDQVATPIGLEWPAGGDAVGGVIAKDQGRWFYAGGCWTLLTILVMGAFSLSLETGRLARRFAPVSIFVDRKTTFAAIGFGCGALPLLLSGATGLVVGSLLVWAPTQLPGTGASLSPAVMLIMSGLTVLAAMVVGLRCWVMVSAASKTG
ncbi:MAG: hypothetical protein LBG70_01085, partial [Bifidobacteriaceae bacterium]|nr:hypothetical protein [Bifidobacteriaceae bacterium]